MAQTSRFGDLHIRTYDIELLISGALVFGLLQAPEAIAQAFEYWSGRVDGIAARATTYLYVYGEMLVYTLLLTFVLHLCLRGYWVALLGLESVWTDGWEWDRVKLGAYSRPHAERIVGSLADAINRADDRASIVFGAGALLVVVFLYSLGVVAAAIVAGAALGAATGIDGGRIFSTAVLLGLMPLGVVPLVDRWIGGRLPRTSVAGRVFDRIAAANVRLSPLRWIGPIQFVFQSRVGERRLSLAMGATAALMAAAMLTGLLFRTGTLRVDGWRYFDPAPGAGSFDPQHYRDSGAARDGRRPSIDSDVIRGPLLRLYLPYRPRRLNQLIAESCPTLASEVARGGRVDNAAAAACVGGLHTVSLDGAAVSTTYEFTRDAASDYVGVMAYLPTATLERGRHELVIDGPGGGQRGARETVRIPFYTAPWAPQAP